MRKFFNVMLGVTLLSAAALAQTNPEAVDPPVPGPFDQYQVRYMANLTATGNYIDMTNAGTVGGDDVNDLICANVYVFAQDQQLITCCTCPLSPNDLRTLSASDLIGNTLTPGVPTGISVGIVATEDYQGFGPHTCNAAIADFTVPGLRAWGTTLHAGPTGLALTETAFSYAGLSIGEYAKMTSFCGFIQADGSGFGVCNNMCAQTAQGASKQ